jgi:hypothetical protein
MSREWPLGGQLTFSVAPARGRLFLLFQFRAVHSAV